MGLTLHQQKLTKVTYNYKKRLSSESGSGLYHAMVTGDKSKVSKRLIGVMQDFGLMHLLTPSGLHLSSFLLLFHYFPRLRIMIVLSLLMSSFFITGFMALKRMLIFYFLNYFFKNIKLSFLGTFFFAIAIGNYSESPLSFCFTFIFWGSIVFSEGSKWMLAKQLFLYQAIVAILFNQEINLLAVVLNPLVSASFTLIFPLMLICYPIPLLKGLGTLIADLGESFILLLESLSFLNVPGIMAVALFIALALKKRYLLVVFGLIFVTSLNHPIMLKRYSSSKHYPLPSHHEILKTGRFKINYIDRTCRFRKSGNFKCRKRPSKFGGPSI